MDELDLLAAEASTCPRCDLALSRTQVVFGDGDPGAEVVLVGEGPGADEDRLGVPFVGRSGQLLTRLVEEELGLATSEGITALRGRAYPWRGATLVPTFHPAAALRGGAATVHAMRSDLGRARLVLEAA